MSKLTRVQKILISLITVFMLFTIVFSMFRYANPFSNNAIAGFDFFSSLKYGLIDYPVQTFTNWVNDFTSLWNVRNENIILRREVDGIASLQAQLAEVKRENEELKELNELKTTLTEYNLVNTTVMSRDPDYYSNSIVIGLGSNDGIANNLAVITPKGLIGKITKVYDDHSLVKLLTSEDGLNKVSVKIQVNETTTAEAVLERYDRNKEAFVLKLLDTGNTIAAGMSVITSGAGGVYPSGLNVGVVLEVEELTNAVGMTIYVKPSADFHNFNYVSVVKRGLE